MAGWLKTGTVTFNDISLGPLRMFEKCPDQRIIIILLYLKIIFKRVKTNKENRRDVSLQVPWKQVLDFCFQRLLYFSLPFPWFIGNVLRVFRIWSQEVALEYEGHLALWRSNWKNVHKTSYTHRPLAVIVVNDIVTDVAAVHCCHCYILLWVCTGGAAAAVGVVVAEVVFAAAAVADACISGARGLANKLPLRLYRCHALLQCRR